MGCGITVQLYFVVVDSFFLDCYWNCRVHLWPKCLVKTMRFDVQVSAAITGISGGLREANVRPSVRRGSTSWAARLPTQKWVAKDNLFTINMGFIAFLVILLEIYIIPRTLLSHAWTLFLFQLGSQRIHLVRSRGGNTKFRALRLDTGNFSWGSESKCVEYV